MAELDFDDPPIAPMSARTEKWALRIMFWLLAAFLLGAASLAPTDAELFSIAAGVILWLSIDPRPA